MVDVLTQVLSRLRVETTLFALARLVPDWGVEFPPGTGAYFHVVSGDDGWLRIDGAAPRHVAPGDVVLLAHGSAHRLTSTVDGIPRVTFDPAVWRPNQVHHDDASCTAATSPASLVCGTVDARDAAGQPLLSLLPDVLVVDGAHPDRRDLELTLGLLRYETERPGPGTGVETMLARLGDILLVQLVRAWLEREDLPHRGWLGALADPAVGRALTAMHGDLARPWTIAELAEQARLSRSRFAERFSELVGEAPLRYLTRWRLDTADDLLRRGQSIRAVARTVGYSSEPAFSRAFTRQHGVPPSLAQPGPGAR